MAFFGLTLACLIKFMHLLSLLVQHAFLSFGCTGICIPRQRKEQYIIPLGVNQCI